MSSSLSIYQGIKRKLILSFDVGTTYSGVSYSILCPGELPEIKTVTRFPAQDVPKAKIPTVIYYDRAGKVRAVGAEAMKDGIFETAEEEDWIKAEWFILHLRNKSGAVNGDIPPLPLNKTVVEVFADFLRYLFSCAADYIKETHSDRSNLWKSVENDIEFVLSHPNGWEVAQLQEMQKAAILAGLIRDDTSGHARLTFVAEGEAILHYALRNDLHTNTLTNGDGVVIIDAGGGTIGITSYRYNTTTGGKETFDEMSAPQCHFHGYVFVTINARIFIDNFLADSPFIDDLEHIVRCFDKTTKLRFRNQDEPQYVKFGSLRDNDQTYNIRFGQLKLSGTDVASFFQPSINCIVKAVLEQQKAGHSPVTTVVLAGVFAESDWLYRNVEAQLEPAGLKVFRAVNQSQVQVSYGSVAFYLHHNVSTRVSKFTYGNLCHIRFDSKNPEHQLRMKNAFTSASGEKRISDSFDVILPKNTQISETKEFRKPYVRDLQKKADLKDASFQLWCYKGDLDNPEWKDQDIDNYTLHCIVTADLYQVPLRPRANASGYGIFYRLEYEIILLFGLEEFQACVAWEENGIEKRTAAKIVFQ